MTLPTDRVRQHTAASALQTVDDTTAGNLLHYAEAPSEQIGRRMQALDREWDTDRLLELEAAGTGLLGLALGALLRPAFYAIPAVVGGAVLLHALKGPYPLLPLFRRFGVRSSGEIARERYALKALRGDFVALSAEAKATPLGDLSTLGPTAQDDRYH